MPQIKIIQSKYLTRATLKLIYGSAGLIVGFSSLIAFLEAPTEGNTLWAKSGISLRTLSIYASIFGIVTGSYFIATGADDRFMQYEMLEKHFNSAFKKTYFIKALLEDVQAV